MGRRSKLRDEGNSSESDDAEDALDGLSGDELAEARQFGAYGRKKRKRGGSMWDAVSDDDAAPSNARGLGSRSKQSASSLKMHKMPTFVNASTKTAVELDPAPEPAAPLDIPDAEAPLADGASDDSGGSSENDMDVSEDEAPPEPAAMPKAFTGGNAGIGARSGAGLGSADPPARPKVSFLSNGGKPAAPKPATQLTADEKRQFNSLERQGGIGFKLLSKMGWNAQGGLGQQGFGIVAPVESKLRPKGFGIGAGGHKERTKQAIIEAKRRGEVISDDEDEAKRKRKPKRGADAEPGDRSNAWRQPQARKSKPVYRTYEEIVADAGDQAPVDGGVGQIVDLTGAALPSLTSSLSKHGLGPSFDTSRLPELRHNIRYILDTARGELDTFAREAKMVEETRKWLDGEERKVGARVATESTRIARLQQINVLVTEIEQAAKLASAMLESPLSAQLAHFSDPFERLVDGFVAEYQDFALDEVVVGAIGPVLKRAWVDWDPLDEPTAHIDDIGKWRKAFRLDAVLEADSSKNAGRTMSAYESLMWTVWLPRVRSAIKCAHRRTLSELIVHSGSWDANRPEPAIKLLQAWSPLLPRFIYDNILDQLMLPKVSKAVGDWTPRRSTAPLHAIVLPWLEVSGEDRMDEVLGEAKRRLRGYLRTWRAKDGLPDGFDLWRHVYSARDWDELMLSHVLPQLGADLRDRFIVDPRDQKLEPLEGALAWRSLLRPNMVGQLLESEFFPKWLDALYIWLTHDPNFDQVADWYSKWKAWFPADVVALPGVALGFGKGLDLMHKAMSLGDDAKYRLKRPDSRPAANGAAAATAQSGARKAISERIANNGAPSVSFRTIVEEHAARSNLLFMPAGASHAATGFALYRVSRTPGGKGLSVYLRDDVVFAQSAQDAERYEPVSVDDMVARARGT